MPGTHFPLHLVHGHVPQAWPPGPKRHSAETGVRNGGNGTRTWFFFCDQKAFEKSCLLLAFFNTVV